MYIFNLLILVSEWVNLLITVPFLISYYTRSNIKLPFYTVTYIGGGEFFPSALFEPMCIAITAVACGALIPFFLFKFCWNINPRKFNIMWATPYAQEHKEVVPIYLLPQVAVVIVVILTVLRYGNLGLEFIAETHGSGRIFNQHVYVMPEVLFLAWVDAGGSALILKSILIVIRYAFNPAIEK